MANLITTTPRKPELLDEQPPGSIVVEISNTQGFLVIDEPRLMRLACEVLRTEGVHRAVISLAIVDNPTIHRINIEHLKHDWPTDVISFLLSGPDDSELAGELVISAQMASGTATELGGDAHDELDLYLVHGLLHLCGYDDTTDELARTMRDRECQALDRAAAAGTTPSHADRFRGSEAGQEQAPWSR